MEANFTGSSDVWETIPRGKVVRASTWQICVVYTCCILNLITSIMFFMRTCSMEQNIIFKKFLLVLCGWLFADFCSGVYHWFADTYRTQSDNVNAVLFDNFQIHHVQPYLIAEHDIFWVNWETNLLSICMTGIAIYFDSIFWFIASLGTMVVNQVHRMNHSYRKTQKKPFALKMLWKCCVIQDPNHHSKHHTGLHNTSYCILTPLLNPILDFLTFWRGLEYFVRIIIVCAPESYTHYKERADVGKNRKK